MVNPENIHCLAFNYKGVGSSIVEPLYFVKSKSSLCFDNASVRYPKNSNELWTEAELGIVIKEDCFDISEEEANKFIEGFLVCGDVTCKNIISRDHHLGFSKSRENYCPVSSLVVNLSFYELKKLKLSTSINGKITQVGCIEDMVYNPYKSLSYISTIAKLKKGDIILTGTPSGVENNNLRIGDKVVHTIEKIGEVSFVVEK